MNTDKKLKTEDNTQACIAMLLLLLEFAIYLAVSIVIAIKTNATELGSIELFILVCLIPVGAILIATSIVDILDYTDKTIHYSQIGTRVLKSEREQEGFTGEVLGNLENHQTVKGINGENYSVRLIKGNSTPELQEGFYKNITASQTLLLLCPIGKLLVWNKKLCRTVEETNIYVHRITYKTLTQTKTTI